VQTPNTISWLSLALKWSARLISVGYLAFFLFMLVAHLTPGGEPFGKLILVESLAFLFVGVYFTGNLIGWKTESLGGAIGLAGVLGFVFAANPKLHLPTYMIVPCLLFIASTATSMWSRVQR